MNRLIRCCAMLAAAVLLPPAAHAQGSSAWTPANRNLQVEMLFPGGNSKALILSYDDSSDSNRELVRLLNKYRLKGTFHLNAGKLNSKGALDRTEVATLFSGHEVSIHGYNHIGMKGLSDLDLFYEVGEDRRVLEMVSGRHVRGMAYPFGSYSERLFNALGGMGMEYARTVEDSHAFGIPDNALAWHPSIHKFANAGAAGNSPDANKAEIARFQKLTDDFLGAKQLALYYVWGHSWEYTTKWPQVEAFFQSVANRADVSYVTHIELVDYLNAYRALKISADKARFLNVSAQEVFIRVSDYADLNNVKAVVLRIPPGQNRDLGGPPAGK